MHAKDLSKVPPGIIVSAGRDPLRDEGEAYGKRLNDAGVATEVVRGLAGLLWTVDERLASAGILAIHPQTLRPEDDAVGVEHPGASHGRDRRDGGRL